jgi:phospholipase A1
MRTLRFTAIGTLVIALMCVPCRSTAQESDAPWKGAFERYHDNYVVGGFNFDAQVKFQLSIRYRIFTNYPLYFSYSQKSFWDLYDWANSTPFKETNYNPELFYRITPGADGSLRFFQAGIEHESNGQKGPSSRSWNRLTVESRITIVEGVFALEPRFWVPFAVADENSDIRSYIGFGQVTSILFIFPDPSNNWVEITLRPGFENRIKDVALQVNIILRPLTSLGFDMFGINPALLLQFWNGYGENLLEYNVHSTRFRVGFTF